MYFFLSLKVDYENLCLETLRRCARPVHYTLLTFIKYSCFACLIWHFPGNCSGAIKSGVPLWLCFVHVVKTVLVWWISDLDSPKWESPEFTLYWVVFRLFLGWSYLFLQHQWYLSNVYNLLEYLQASNLGRLFYY